MYVYMCKMLMQVTNVLIQTKYNEACDLQLRIYVIYYKQM